MNWWEDAYDHSFGMKSGSRFLNVVQKFSLSGRSELLQILNSCKWGYYYFENQSLRFLYAGYYCFCFKCWIREKFKYIECYHALGRIFNNNNLALSSYVQMLHCNQVNKIAPTALPWVLVYNIIKTPPNLGSPWRCTK